MLTLQHRAISLGIFGLSRHKSIAFLLSPRKIKLNNE